MVYKKYIKKGNKIHGPYLYKSVKKDGKVITKYLGAVKNLQRKNILKKPAGFFILSAIIILGIFILFYFNTLTGKITLSIDSDYEPGEQITGDLKIVLKHGELIPASSKLVISNDGYTREYVISELVSENTIEGNFYTENTEISGSGSGYGIPGQIETYPEVDFTLKISEISKEEKTETEEQIQVTETSEEKQKEEQVTETTTSEATDTETQTESTQETQQEETETEVASEPQTETTNEATTQEPSPITGEVVSETGTEIQGKVSKGNPFTYTLNEGETADVTSSSEDVNVKIEGDKLIVTTEYAEIEKGFGERYILGNTYKMNINLDKINLTAQKGELNAGLYYNDIELASVTKNIVIKEKKETKKEEKITEDNETIAEIVKSNLTRANITESFNVTETNITIVNTTITNITEINITTGNATISTIQYGAVLGKPVKWKKTLLSEQTITNVNIELPKLAENITAYKIIREESGETREEIEEKTGTTTETQQATNEATQTTETNTTESIEQKVQISASVITGEVALEFELDNEKSIITRFFRKIVRAITGTITGKASIEIQEETDIKHVIIEENSTEFEIEYETPAPVAYESNTTNSKNIIISGPEEIHYENILAFTELPREISINSISSIRLYHIVEETINITDNQSVNIIKIPVNFDSYDTNNNSLADYIEWLVPSLSNQTYQLIIEITKAEHLDSNRAFISDIYNEVKALDGNWSEAINNNEYVRVTFETPLDNTRDITLYSRTINGTPRIEVYEISGNEIITEFTTLTDNQYNKVYLTNLNSIQDVFDLRVIDGSVEFEHIIDPASAWTWNISSAVYMVNIPALDISPFGVFFKPDGTKMYTNAYIGKKVLQFTLSNAWNISSAVNEVNFSLVTPLNNPTSLFFKPDGTKMYIINDLNDTIHQLTLSDAWNISSAVYDNVNFNITQDVTLWGGLFFKPDGTKMYITGDQRDMVYQYNLSDAWNVSSAVYDNVNFSVTSRDNLPRGLFFEPYGTKMYIAGNQNDRVYQYNLSDSWNVSSAVYEDNFSVTTQDTTPWSLFFKSDGTRMYITGNTGDRVYQYSLPSSDTTYPIFSNYYDNNGTLLGSGIALFNVTVENTNGTVYLYINNTNYPATNLTSNVYNVSVTLSNGTYQYNWTAYGNGISNNLNTSDNRYYTVNASISDTTPPNVTINTPLNQTYNTNLIIFNVTALDETGMSTCLYTLTNGVTNYTMVNSTSSIWNATNSTMSQGSQTVRFYCNDTTNNLNNSETKTFVVDTITPLVSIIYPQNITYAVNVSSLNYTYSDANAGVCWHSNDNGATNSSTQTPSANFTNIISSEGSNTWKLYCNDTSNNLNTTSITFVKDTIKPLISIITPTNGRISSDTLLDVNYTVSDANSGISNCWYSNDTMSINTTLSGCANITTITWSEGQHNVTIWANDTLGNMNSTSVAFTIDSTPPAISYGIGTQSNLAVVGNNWVYVNLSVTEANENTITFNLYNSTGSINSSSYTDARRTINWTNLTDGEYSYNVTINDTVGASSSSGTNRITLDTTSPSISLSSPADAYSSTSTSVVFQYTVSDAQETNCTLILDGSNADFEAGVNFEGGTNSFTNTTSVASHTWRISCTDFAGNTGTSSSRTFTITSGSSSSSSSSSGGGGGGAGVATTTPEVKFNINKESLEKKLVLNRVEFDSFEITNKEDTEKTFSISVVSLEDIISIDESEIKVLSGESADVKFRVIAHEKPGIYTGKIIVSSGNTKKEILVIVNIKTEKSLYDVVLSIPKSMKTINTGEGVFSQIDLIQMGIREKMDVTLHYVIKNFLGDTILEESETIAVEGQKSITKDFNTESLEAGDYVLGVEVVYPDGVAVSSSQFKVKGKFEFTEIKIITAVITVVLTAVIILIFIRIRGYKKKIAVKLKK